MTQFKEQGLNTELYYKNKEMGETFNIVPTSAIRYLFVLKNSALKQLHNSYTSKFEIVFLFLVVKAYQTCYCYWYNGLRRLWLKN